MFFTAPVSADLASTAGLVASTTAARAMRSVYAIVIVICPYHLTLVGDPQSGPRTGSEEAPAIPFLKRFTVRRAAAGGRL
jgi:hypothetical protein